MTTQDLNPLGYMGVKEKSPPNIRYFQRDPLPSDIVGFDIGDFWVNTLLLISWQLISKAGGVAVWAQVAGGSAQVSTLTPDSLVAVSPITGNINLYGTTAQGVTTTNLAGGIQITNANATTAQKGVVLLATNAEAITGTDTAKAITADDLKAKLGTQTQYGVLVGQGTTLAVTATGAGTTGQVLHSGNGAADPSFSLVTLTTDVTGVLPIANGGTNANAMATNTGIVKFDGTRLITSTTATIDSANRFTNTSQPCFSAYNSGGMTDCTGDGTIVSPVIFDTAFFDQAANYAANVFTAPVAGKYLFGTTLQLKDVGAAHTQLIVLLNYAATTISLVDCNPGAMVDSAAHLTVNGSIIVSLATGQTASIYLSVSGGLKVVDVVARNSTFYGYLVC